MWIWFSPEQVNLFCYPSFFWRRRKKARMIWIKPRESHLLNDTVNKNNEFKQCFVLDFGRAKPFLLVQNCPELSKILLGIQNVQIVKYYKMGQNVTSSCYNFFTTFYNNINFFFYKSMQKYAILVFNFNTTKFGKAFVGTCFLLRN